MTEMLAQSATVSAAVGALVVEILVYIAVTVCAFVVESIDDRARRRSAASALASLAATVALGWLLIPVAGAAGALVAISAGWVIRCPLLRDGVKRAKPSQVDLDQDPYSAPATH